MAGRTRRDALGAAFFGFHVAVLLFVLLGWAMPGRVLLSGYLIFLPLLALHWKLNGNACALNNLESWLRYRRWRAPDRNPEEGAWLRMLLARHAGLVLSRSRMDVVLHGGLALLWLGALAHFFKS